MNDITIAFAYFVSSILLLQFAIRDYLPLHMKKRLERDGPSETETHTFCSLSLAIAYTFHAVPGDSAHHFSGRAFRWSMVTVHPPGAVMGAGDRFGDHLGAFYAALRRLLRTPAPDIAALAMKIALAVDHEVGTLTGGERCLAALKADARRLAPPPLG